MVLRVAAAAAFFSLISALSAAEPNQAPDFNRDVKPILSNNCYFCHGPDEAERKGGSAGVRLDTTDAFKVEDGKAPIVPGKPDASEVIRRVLSHDKDEMMPPPSLGKRLTAKEIETLKAWIAAGAPYAEHWSYKVPVRPTVPSVKNAAWPRNEIDRFLLARMEKEGLKPSPEADRYALVRRLSLDLTGLPPTPAEADAFANDPDPQAYEKLVDKLLAKETYGEHWAHFWLDLARYADSAGYADDPARTIWLYRDYVIRSLNANKPFDQFTIEQIAGDLLPNPTEDQLAATAFHRNTLTNNEGGTNDEEFRNVAIVDRVNTTLAVWMGTTIACAQCHSHKYDPLSQEEFFKLFAIFNNTEDADRGDESPLYSRMTEEQQKQSQAWKDELAELEKTLKTPTPELTAALAKWEAAFPRELKWRSLKPGSFAAESGNIATIADDGVITVAKDAKNDEYTLDIPATGAFRALRLDTIPGDPFPGKGAGFGGGNFVVTGISAAIVPPAGQPVKGRYVRVELPGPGKFLSLAEVQVYQGGENIALAGEAKQISTDYDGPAKLAIDGNTNGDFNVAKSTTHTASADNPWWEVDLKSERPIDRVVVWNRTDGAVGGRLAGYRITVLNEKHEPVSQTTDAALPSPSYEWSLSGSRAVPFAVAVADYNQASFDAASLLDVNEKKRPKKQKERGWAVGGKIAEPHALTLVTAAPVEIPEGSKLVVTIEQESKHVNHTLGRFKLSLTDDPSAADYAKTPAAVIEAIKTAATARTPEQQKVVTDYFLSQAPELEPTRKRLAEVNKELAAIKPITVPIMKELPKERRRVTKLQHRGNFLDLGKEVQPGLPAVFASSSAGEETNRLTLAKWLIDEKNPLTARVIANRYWEQIFGIGIVATSEEFGAQGDLPFHPELLDWLATELTRLKWDTKAFVKELVTSAAYRQSSKVSPEAAQADPDNRYLARGPRFRLSAEMIRDQALATSGLLSVKMYGPPVKPPQPTLGVSAAFGGGIDWATSMGEDKFRRALYTTWRRSNPYPSMATFDAPNREVCTLRRVRTNTPLQALVTLNDPVYIEAAQALAAKTIAEGGATPTEKVNYAFRRVLTRPPHAGEVARLVALFEQTRDKLAKEPEQAKKLAADPLPAGVAAPEAAAWTMVGNVLLNLDETLMKR